MAVSVAMAVRAVMAFRVGGFVRGAVIVQLEGTGLTGAVAVESLPGKGWEEDPGTHSLVSKDGRRFGVGRAMRVRIVGTDEEQGHIDLEPV